MRRVGPLVLVGVLAYGIFLAALVPARYLYGWVAPHMHEVAMGGVAGSLWSGRAARVVVNGRDLGSADWQLRPQALLLGRLEYQLRWGGELGQGTARVGDGVIGSAYVRQLHAELPASGLAKLFGSDMPVKLGGALRAHLKRVSFGARWPDAASGEILWEHAEVMEPVAMALGGFKMQLENAKDGIRGVIKDSGGPLQVQGVATLAGNGSYRLTATLKPRGPKGQQLRSELQLLGPPDRNGRYSLALSGSL
ncbi:MAG TPA: type II secretion system protein N [Gammaproteobacteria bacterium]|nr:type II secretion system protein N [Gammaproteobacteria bacterium]